jgi:hypothetical protein
MIAFLLCLAAAPQAAPPKPDLVVNLDWALGQAVPGAWQSVLVDLQNPSPKDRELRAEVEEEITGTRVSRLEAVPAGGRRRFHLTLPLGAAGRTTATLQLRLRILDAAGKELAARTLVNSGGWSMNSVTIAVLTRDRSAEGAFRIPRRIGSTDVVAVFPSARTFPDHWTALAGVRVLALHDAPLSELSPDQSRAILDFARRGGTVLLSPGAQRDWLSHPAIAALAEIRTGESERRSGLPALGLPRTEPFLYHPILNGASLDVADEPKIAEFRAFASGFGRVLALPFDIALAPVAGSLGLERLWVQALAGNDEEGGAAGLPSTDLSSSLNSLTSLVNPYPSFVLLAGLSALYLAAVGPVNYLLLRRLRMTILLVLTVPLISFAFLGVVLGVGYLLKGSTTVVCSVRFLATRPGAPVALESQLATVFSPEARSYRVSFPRDRAPLPLERAVGGNDRLPAPLAVEEGADRAFAAVSIGQWQTWPAIVTSTAELGRGIRFERSEAGLKVSNGSPLAIARGLHVRRVGDRNVGSPFGAAAPGADAAAPLAAARWEPMSDLGFGPGSVGAAVFEGALDGRFGLASSGPGTQRAEVLLCVLADDSPLLEIDARAPGRERSLVLLAVWKEGR